MSDSEDENFFRDRTAYELSIELGNYRGAVRHALSALRRNNRADGDAWHWRFRGAWTRRNRKGVRS